MTKNRNVAGLTLIAFVIFVLGSCAIPEPFPSNRTSQSEPVIPDSNIANSADVTSSSNTCYIPIPDKKKKTSERETFGTAPNGDKVKVIISTFVPVGEFTYDLTSTPKYAITGRVRLQMIYELKTHGRVYGYSIFARRVAPDLSSNTNSWKHDHMFVYRCFDSDGDGKFETLLNDSSSFSIPSWVLN